MLLETSRDEWAGPLYRVARMPAHGPVVGGLSEYRGTGRPSMNVMSCINPIAPLDERARGLNADSV